MTGFWPLLSSWFADGHFHSVLTWQRERASKSSLMSPPVTGPYPDDLPKGPSPILSHWELGLEHRNLVAGDINIQSTADDVAGDEGLTGSRFIRSGQKEERDSVHIHHGSSAQELSAWRTPENRSGQAASQRTHLGQSLPGTLLSTHQVPRSCGTVVPKRSDFLQITSSAIFGE